MFGDGSRHGVRIAYHEEDTPRGTAGPLASIDGLDETFLMLNGAVRRSALNRRPERIEPYPNGRLIGSSATRSRANSQS